MAQLIKTDGTIVEIEPENGTKFSLDEMQSLVGGWVQLVRLKNRKIMLINDDGKPLNLPYNREATEICHENKAIHPFDCIVGNAVICLSKQF